MKCLRAKMWGAILTLFCVSGALKAYSDSINIADMRDQLEIPDQALTYYWEDISYQELLTQINYDPQMWILLTKNGSEQREWTRKYLERLQKHPYLNIENIAKKKFISRVEHPPQFDHQEKFVWYKFQLDFDEAPKKSEHIVLSLGRFANKAWLYTKVDKTISYAGFTGYDLVHGHDNWISPDNYIPIVVEPGTKKIECYLALYTIRSHHNWRPTLVREQVFRRTTLTELVFFSIFTGAALIILLYNLGVFLVSRDVAYLYLSISLAFYIPFFIDSNLGRLSPWSVVGALNRNMFVAILFAWMSSLFLFTRSALQLNQFTFLNRAYKIVFWTNLLIGLLVLLQKQLSYPIAWIYMANKYSTVSGITIFLLTSIFLIFQKQRVAWIYLVATILWILGIYITLLGITGQIPMTLYTYNAQHLGLLVFLIMWSIALGDKLRVLNKSLKQYIGNVEAIVEEKTAKIVSIMKNIKEGIFTIENKGDLVIGEEHSAYLEEILDHEFVANRPVRSTFIDQLNLNADSKSQIESSLLAIIGESSISFDLNNHILPRDLIYTRNSEIRYLEAEWSPVIQDGIVENILVSIKDVTDRKNVEAEAKLAKIELQIVDDILHLTSQQFQEFSLMGHELLDESRSLIMTESSFGPEIIDKLFINTHTLKGMARTCNFTQMTGAIHELESIFSGIKKGESTFYPENVLKRITSIEEILNEYDHVNVDKIGRDQNEHGLNHDQALRLITHLHSDEAKSLPGNDEMIALLSDAYLTPAVDLFEQLFSGVAKLATELGKELPEINLDIDNLNFTKRGADQLRKSFVHLVSNSMNHGLEPAEDRIAKGKEARGCLNVSMSLVGHSIEIFYWDDGKGLDLERIWHKAVSSLIIEETDELNRQEIAELIFEAGFSTAKSINEVSGRGVGMDSVRSFIKEVGGDVTIVLSDPTSLSRECVPVKFKIQLPEECVYMTTAA